MSSMQQSIVKQATQHFRKGDYQRAKACYQQAGQLYGANLFANSVRLCELRMGKTMSVTAPASNSGTAVAAKTPSAPAHTATEQQLSETQHLLEHYFNRCQELEYQLLDRT